MRNVIEVEDCRGYKVICTDEIWYGKILVARPWMNGWEGLVRQTIERPSFICEDATRKKRHAYYMLHVTKHNRYMKAVVVFNSRNEGFVVSAFPADSGKKKEKVIWLPSRD